MVELVNEDETDLEDCASQQRVNLSIKYTKKKACGSYHRQLARAWLKTLDIKFPIKARKQP